MPRGLIYGRWRARRDVGGVQHHSSHDVQVLLVEAYVHSNFFFNVWTMFGKLREARSRLYRRRILQVNTKYSFESSWLDIQ